MKTEPTTIRMKLIRIVTTYRPAVKERYELRSIVRGRPFRKVFHLNFNDVIQFQVAFYCDHFGRERGRRRRRTCGRGRRYNGRRRSNWRALRACLSNRWRYKE